ncbi:MAG: efflux RND transporter permease subunit, partial [Dehalococcoidales bacterium]|nr:efflux RND transporter permease subunit [Dehalococcoidales bacterium]
MWRITKLAVHSRIVTILLALAISGISIWGFFGLKVELIPDISFPYTTIVTIYPQANPDQVVNDVTGPIERFVFDRWTGRELKHVTSTSSSGMSIIMAEFEYGTDMGVITDTLNEGIRNLGLPEIVTGLPHMMDGLDSNPQIIPINMNIMPVMSFSLSGDMTSEQLKQVALTQIVPELAAINGVLRVDTEGGEKDEIVISPDPEAMNQYGVSLSRIFAMLEEDYVSLQAISNAPLGEDGIILSDIATITKSPPPLTAITRVNGQPSVGIQVTKTDSSNTVDVSDAVNERLAEISLPEGVVLTTIFDQSDFIHSSINQLWEKAIIGGVMAIIVVFIFLMAVRASLITAISIPLSLFIGFLCMRLTGVTLNILTLSAMIIAVGRLI